MKNVLNPGKQFCQTTTRDKHAKKYNNKLLVSQNRSGWAMKSKTLTKINVDVLRGVSY